MKVVICGDTHIGAVYGLGKPTIKYGNTRIADYEKSLNHIVDYCIDNKASVFIQTGDVFDSRNPTPEMLEIFDNALKKLSLNNIVSLVIMGNHDYRRQGNDYTSAIAALSGKDLPNVRIFLKPEIISVFDKKEKLDILLLPYRDRKMYGLKNIKDDCDSFEQEVYDLIKDKNPNLVVGHNFYFTGSYNDYGGSEILVKPSLFHNSDFVCMGHQHEFKIVSKSNPIAIYIGSMEKINFGDKNVSKKFIEYNSSDKRCKVLSVPSKELEEINIDLSNVEPYSFYEEIRQTISNSTISSKIIRIKILTKESHQAMIKTSEVEKIAYHYGCDFISYVKVEPVIERIIQDEKILECKDDMEMFSTYLMLQKDIPDLEKEKIMLEFKLITDKK